MTKPIERLAGLAPPELPKPPHADFKGRPVPSRKAKLAAATSLLTPVGVVITADDGGVGKTHLTIQILTALRLQSLPAETFQLDTKGTLAEKTGEPVTSLIMPDLRQPDGVSVTDVIIPWYEAWTAMPTTGRSVVVELGGALASVFHSGCSDLDTHEDMGMLAIRLVAMVVTKAGGDAAAQLLREVRRWERTMPDADVVIVLNEMNGCPILASAHLEPELRARFLRTLERYPTMRMPRLNARSMALYERTPALPSTIVSWHADNYVEAIARTGAPRHEAKRFVRDLAIWTAEIQNELARVLPFLRGENTNG